MPRADDRLRRRHRRSIRRSGARARSRRDLDDLQPDGDAGDLALSRGHRRRARASSTGRARTSTGAGRLIVVVSDGLNSADGSQRPSRALGDTRGAGARADPHDRVFARRTNAARCSTSASMSKRSNGTFRWAKTADDLRAQIETLTDELNKQYVLTYKISTRARSRAHASRCRCGELTSNPLVYDSSGGTSASCRRRGRCSRGGCGRSPGWSCSAAAPSIIVARARRRSR